MVGQQARAVAHVQTGHDVLDDREIGKQADVLKGARDPAGAFSSGALPVTSWPRKRIRPRPLGFSTPEIRLKAVVLPEPFGRSVRRSSPCATEGGTRRRARARRRSSSRARSTVRKRWLRRHVHRLSAKRRRDRANIGGEPHGRCVSTKQADQLREYLPPLSTGNFHQIDPSRRGAQAASTALVQALEPGHVRQAGGNWAVSVAPSSPGRRHSPSIPCSGCEALERRQRRRRPQPRRQSQARQGQFNERIDGIVALIACFASSWTPAMVRQPGR